MTDENSSQGQRQRLPLPLVSRCGMPLLKHLLCQLTYRRLPFFRFSIHCETLVPFHLIVPELGTTSSAATIMAFMKNILSFNLNCTTLSNHQNKFPEVPSTRFSFGRCLQREIPGFQMLRKTCLFKEFQLFTFTRDTFAYLPHDIQRIRVAYQLDILLYYIY